MFRRLLVIFLCLAGSSYLAGSPVAVAATIGYPVFPASSPVHRSSGACSTDVTDYLAGMARDGDVTSAFADAMADAVARYPTCYLDGPGGEPQAVVYVPPGTYRLAGLYFPSNVRMEVDAGATLQLPPNRSEIPSGQATPMIKWDSRVMGQPALQNVSLIGVGRNLDETKRALKAGSGKPLSPFDLSHDFTMNLDPASTGSTNYNPGMSIVNVQHFQVTNLFTIQNDTNQSSTPIINWPTSARAVLELHARHDSPMGGGALLEPRDGVITNQVNVGSPRSNGPNAVNAVDNLSFQNVYSSGGTALRLETDGSTDDQGMPDRGATIDHLTGQNIVGVNCNRAVSLSPHAQANGTVDISSVWAYSCNEAVVASVDGKLPPEQRGKFEDATVSDVHVSGGYNAQLDADTMLWYVGESLMPVYIAPDLMWTPHIEVVATAGPFTRH